MIEATPPPPPPLFPPFLLFGVEPLPTSPLVSDRVFFNGSPVGLLTPQRKPLSFPRIGKGFLSKWAQARRMQALDELAQMSQDLGLYD